jgi:hypothetical protein
MELRDSSSVNVCVVRAAHETSRLFFTHYWANDNASDLAAGLRAALDRMNVKKAAP